MSSPAVIKLEQVIRTFPRAARTALAGISASIHPGRVTGLVGPDGAGKTTLMRLLAGLLVADSGKLEVNGLDPARAGERLRQVIGYMPQKFGLYEDLTVLENLRLHADLRGVVGAERTTAFSRLLGFTGLEPFGDRLAGKLSGGMKQKLGLACALLGHPQILLLDEPGVGVDPISRRELWRMVRELSGRGMTVLWSTAYLDEAELCEEVLLLNEGELLFAGSPNAIKERLAGRCLQIRHIDGSRRELLSRALRRPEILDGTIQGHSVRLVLRKGSQAIPLGELGAGPRAEIVEVPPRFEDAFIDLVGGGPGGDSPLAQHVQERAASHDIVVEAKELTRRFGAFTAADRINFAVRRGEVFGLLGPNGAGKSTTFRMLCGLLRPTSGTALVMGIDLKTSPGKARQRLGYMAQKFSLYGNLTVRQNLEFFSGVYGLRNSVQNEAISRMVEAFRFEPLLSQTAESLPLGFKQRLALACAVMHEPDILFLDEPTSGVDPVTRREFWMHINGLVAKSITIVVTTHFMEEAEYCDRLALVSRGKVIAAGTPDELKDMASEANDEPGMEETFIRLVERQTREETT
jgi:ABC-2 type transport system ATP-binding protein